MAQLLDLSSVPYVELARGAWRAALVDDQRPGSREMVAALYRLAPGGRAALNVPAGSDGYLFTLSGGASLSGADGEHRLEPRTFVVLREAARYELGAAHAGEAVVLSVTAPPPGVQRGAPGARNGTWIARIADLPVVSEPESGKRRVYLVTEDTTGSKRAHGMIVTYRGDTVTAGHHHPDAESLFVFLDGHGIVLVNDAEVHVRPGQAVFYGYGDRHALRSADEQGMAFLEFHIPGVYQVVGA